MVSQIIGFGIVALGLRETGKVFNHPGFIGRFLRHLRQTPPFKSHAVVFAGSASIKLKVGKARVRIRAAANAPLKQRIDVLERNHDALDGEVGKLISNLDTMRETLEASLAEETKERQVAVTDLGAKIEKAAAGGISVELLGVLFFVLGVVMGTASPEINSLLHNIGI